MKITTVIGLVAATITTLSFIPQLIKTWKLKETKDISLLMFVTLGVGIILWIIYGFILWDLPLILANGITFIFVLVILFFKFKYK
ncbi:MAG: SemiSWEET transporter [Deltaproteobacteria bacterium]|nr:SemiSWEET transporter [Nitrospinota bacterium]MBI3755149.1 SemiSWEET transporter [Deltaproteobacteria bacterium]